MLDEIHIVGYKSIKKSWIELKRLNVIIGPNGVGKSNFLSIFKFLNALLTQRLQHYIGRTGANSVLHYGIKQTEELSLGFFYDDFAYRLGFEPNLADELLCNFEQIDYNYKDNAEYPKEDFTSLTLPQNITSESVIFHKSDSSVDDKFLKTLFAKAKSFAIYHFNDTSENSKLKSYSHVDDNKWLREDGSNIAAFLYWIEIRYRNKFEQIIKAIQRVAPSFHKFNLSPSRLRDHQIKLEWQEKASDHYFDAHSLSDGTLRMICLATALLQPNPPNTIIIDEPELGLHPAAITILVALIRKAVANGTQVIIATQSPTLLNHFSPEDIIVVDKKDDASTFKRLNNEDLSIWLEDYTMGEIWQKNLVGGRP